MPTATSLAVGSAVSSFHQIIIIDFYNVNPQQIIAWEEIFIPVLSVTSFESGESSHSAANISCYGLAAYAAMTSGMFKDRDKR